MAGEPTLRADARRNREQIVQAARALFSRSGPMVPLEEVARAAGVGVATLYRRFPDRDRLIEAVSHDNVARLAELARRAERDEPDAAVAFTTLLRSVLDLRLGLILSAVSPGIYRTVLDSPPIVEQREEVIAVLGRLLRRAQADGAVRPDVGVGDAVLALTLVSQVVPPSGDDRTMVVFDRLFALVLDGLRATDGSPLPGHPLDYRHVEDLHRRGMLQHSRPEPPGPADTR